MIKLEITREDVELLYRLPPWIAGLPTWLRQAQRVYQCSGQGDLVTPNPDAAGLAVANAARNLPTVIGVLYRDLQSLQYYPSLLRRYQQTLRGFADANATATVPQLIAQHRSVAVLDEKLQELHSWWLFWRSYQDRMDDYRGGVADSLRPVGDGLAQTLGKMTDAELAAALGACHSRSDTPGVPSLAQLKMDIENICSKIEEAIRKVGFFISRITLAAGTAQQVMRTANKSHPPLNQYLLSVGNALASLEILDELAVQGEQVFKPLQCAPPTLDPNP